MKGERFGTKGEKFGGMGERFGTKGEKFGGILLSYPQAEKAPQKKFHQPGNIALFKCLYPKGEKFGEILIERSAGAASTESQA
jgi:hypothetical protein